MIRNFSGRAVLAHPRGRSVAAEELALGWLCQDAEAAGLRVVRLYEPDVGGALTAVFVRAQLAGDIPPATRWLQRKV